MCGTGHLRHLHILELTRTSPSIIEGGLFALNFLRHLTNLSVTLDLAPAFPATLREVPSRLQQLSMGNMWLQELPENLQELTGKPGIQGGGSSSRY